MASTARSAPVPCWCSVTTRMADAAAWLANIMPSPTNPTPVMTAARNVTNTIRPSAYVEVPRAPLRPSPIPMPSSTPPTSWTMRWVRWTRLTLSVTAAAIGAKNGCWWPRSPWAMNQAMAAARAARTSDDHDCRARASPRTRARVTASVLSAMVAAIRRPDGASPQRVMRELGASPRNRDRGDDERIDARTGGIPRSPDSAPRSRARAMSREPGAGCGAHHLRHLPSPALGLPLIRNGKNRRQ